MRMFPCDLLCSGSFSFSTSPLSDVLIRYRFYALNDKNIISAIDILDSRAAYMFLDLMWNPAVLFE
jgi:hypothetical protein